MGEDVILICTTCPQTINWVAFDDMFVVELWKFILLCEIEHYALCIFSENQFAALQLEQRLRLPTGSNSVFKVV
jgi:hypothetical protein